MGGIQRFLTCEAYDGKLSVDRRRLLRAALPLPLWGCLLVAGVTGLIRPATPVNARVGVLAGMVVILATRWIAGGTPRSGLSRLTQVYRKRLEWAGVFVGLLAWKSFSAELDLARLVWLPILIALFVLPLHAWVRAHWLEPVAAPIRLLRALVPYALLIGMGCYLTLQEWLAQVAAAREWKLLTASALCIVGLALLLAWQEAVRLTQQDLAARAGRQNSPRSYVPFLFGMDLMARELEMDPKRMLVFSAGSAAWIFLLIATLAQAQQLHF